jgi:hypothetical protein
MPKTWEYKVARRGQGRTTYAMDTPKDKNPLPVALNRWGAEGWELVGMVRVDDSHTEYVFKRPLEISEDSDPMRVEMLMVYPEGSE